MAAAGTSFRVFSLGDDISGSPRFIEPSTFSGLAAQEVKDIERWIKKEPLVLGDDLCIVASQFSNFDKTRDRPDLVALDRAGKLVVIELKRDASGSGQDLQAIRYAAYVSTFDAEQVVELYRAYREKEHGDQLSSPQARERLEEFITLDSLDQLDDDEQPRIILVAASFQVGVTSTALWLTRQFGIDLTCVQVTPYEIGGEIVLASTVLIPLPEAADYEVRIQQKRRRASAKKRRPLDFDAAQAFIASIPAGRWASYGDVAAAAGNPRGGQPVGTWLSNKGDDVPNVYRVLKRRGEVSPGWSAASPDLPPTPDAVRAKLIEEGVRFDENNRADQGQRWAPEDWAGEEEADDSRAASFPAA